MASSDGTAAAAALKARGCAGILSSESAGVMAVMRQNAKWALVPGYGYGDEDGPDDPMLEEFRAMRRALFTWRDWDTVAPVAYLAPFLQVIRSVETSGPITGCVTPSGASRSHFVESRSQQRVASRATRPRRFRSILRCARAVRASTRDRSRAARRTPSRSEDAARTLTISSYVSSSISTVVIVSSTSPKIMFRCWSYACSFPRISLSPRSLT